MFYKKIVQYDFNELDEKINQHQFMTMFGINLNFKYIPEQQDIMDFKIYFEYSFDNILSDTLKP